MILLNAACLQMTGAGDKWRGSLPCSLQEGIDTFKDDSDPRSTLQSDGHWPHCMHIVRGVPVPEYEADLSPWRGRALTLITAPTMQ